MSKLQVFDELVPDNLINQNMQEEEIPPAPEPSSEVNTTPGGI